MADKLSLAFGRQRYECDSEFLTIYKKQLFNASKEFFDIRYRISDIEILFYSFEKNPTLIYATPRMSASRVCSLNKDDDHCIEQLYSHLIQHGATERLMPRLLAASTKHSAAIALDKQQKADKALAFAKTLETQRKRTGCKEITEEKYTCVKCKNIWYVSTAEVLLNLGNALHGSVYTLNQVKQFDKCPKCGSTACTHKSVKFWVDKKGNTVDYED